jgi:hypothetical protein
LPSSLQAKLSKKAPFSQYSSVKGLKVFYGDPADLSTYPEPDFDVVYDNNGKDLAACGPIIDACAVRPAAFNSEPLLHADPVEAARGLRPVGRAA